MRGRLTAGLLTLFLVVSAIVSSRTTPASLVAGPTATWQELTAGVYEGQPARPGTAWLWPETPGKMPLILHEGIEPWVEPAVVEPMRTAVPGVELATVRDGAERVVAERWGRLYAPLPPGPGGRGYLVVDAAFANLWTLSGRGEARPFLGGVRREAAWLRRSRGRRVPGIWAASPLAATRGDAVYFLRELHGGGVLSLMMAHREEPGRTLVSAVPPPVSLLGFAPDGRLLLGDGRGVEAVGPAGRVRLLLRGARPVALAPGGAALLWVDDLGNLSLTRPGSGTTYPLPLPGALRFDGLGSFSPHGHRIAVLARDQQGRVQLVGITLGSRGQPWRTDVYPPPQGDTILGGVLPTFVGPRDLVVAVRAAAGDPASFLLSLSPRPV